MNKIRITFRKRRLDRFFEKKREIIALNNLEQIYTDILDGTSYYIDNHKNIWGFRPVDKLMKKPNIEMINHLRKLNKL